MITVHPTSHALAKSLVAGPHADHITIDTPPGGWSREAVAALDWDRAVQQIDALPAQVRSHPGAPVHVIPRLSYGLGLLLGRRLESHSAALHVWQFSRQPGGASGWEDWGPDGVPSTRDGPFFKRWRMPTGLGPEITEVAFIVQITLDMRADVIAALPDLELHPRTPTVTLSAPSPGQTAMSAGDCARAEEEVWDALRRVRQAAPNATIYLFIATPLAFAIRVGRKIHIGAPAVIACEYTHDDGRTTYIPVVRFPDGVLHPRVHPILVDPGKEPLPQLSDLIGAALRVPGQQRLLRSLPDGRALSHRIPQEKIAAVEHAATMMELLAGDGRLDDACFAAAKKALPDLVEPLDAIEAALAAKKTEG